MSDHEFEQLVNDLPVLSTTEDFPVYRGFAAKCIEKGQDFPNFSDWRNGEVTSVAA